MISMPFGFLVLNQRKYVLRSAAQGHITYKEIMKDVSHPRTYLI